MLLNCGVGEDKSPLDCKEIKLVSPKGNQPWVFIGMTDAEAPILCPSDAKSWLIRKDPDAEKDWRQEKGTTEDEMVGWSHWLYGHEFEQAPGIGDGQGSLAYCSPWGRKESDTTEQLKWTELISFQATQYFTADVENLFKHWLGNQNNYVKEKEEVFLEPKWQSQ